MDILFDSYRNDVNGHLNNVQDELDLLKDLLCTDFYSGVSQISLTTALSKTMKSTLTPPLSPPSTEASVIGHYHKDNDEVFVSNDNVMDEDVNVDVVEDYVDSNDNDSDIDSIEENLENDNALIDYLNFINSRNLFLNGNVKIGPATTSTTTTTASATANTASSSWIPGDCNVTAFQCDVLNYLKESAIKDH